MIASDWPSIPGTEDALVMFTIYEHPLDWPRFFVVRRCFVMAPRFDEPGIRNGDPLSPLFDVVPRLATTLAEARELVPYGLYRQPRQEGDDIPIVESWF